MTGAQPRSRRAALAIAAVAGLLCVPFAVSAAGSPAWGSAAAASILLAFGLVVVVGEWFVLAAPGFRVSAPVATAAAFGLAFVVEVPEGFRVPFESSVVLAVVAVSMGLGGLARHLAGRPVHVVAAVGRFLAVLAVVVLFRIVYLGQHAGRLPADNGLNPSQQALLMLGIGLLGVCVDVLFTSAMHLPRGLPTWRRAFVAELRSAIPLSSALAVTGVLVAIAARPLGIVALPLFLVPLVLSQFAFRRYVAIRATYGQSIRTLSRITDLAGYTPAGHSERVAELAVAVGSELGITGRDLLDLEYAALLHDLGQVALSEPIPGGATVLAARADQRRIERDTVDIVRETGVLDDVAAILERHTTPYRQVREFGEEIPLTSRVLKVANAFDDLTRGVRSDAACDAAVERIYLGLGYEYDPRVVDALLRVLRPVAVSD
jgi:hypothetical protein